MKKLLIASLFFFCWHASSAQIENPVQWNFSATKVSPGVYDVVLSAEIDKPWPGLIYFSRKDYVINTRTHLGCREIPLNRIFNLGRTSMPAEKKQRGDQ